MKKKYISQNSALPYGIKKSSENSWTWTWTCVYQRKISYPLQSIYESQSHDG